MANEIKYKRNQSQPAGYRNCGAKANRRRAEWQGGKAGPKREGSSRPQKNNLEKMEKTIAGEENGSPKRGQPEWNWKTERIGGRDH